MLLNTMKEIDKKIIGYYHDYSRMRGGQKLKYNRENLKKFDSAVGSHTIKIEDDHGQDSQAVEELFPSENKINLSTNYDSYISPPKKSIVNKLNFDIKEEQLCFNLQQ